MVNTTESDSTASSCSCNVHQEHLFELRNGFSDFPLTTFENMLRDNSGNCVICNFNISSSDCTRCHECACPSDASIILETERSTASKASTRTKRIGPSSFEDLDAIVNVTDCDSQTVRSNSETRQPEQFENLDQFSYTKHEKDHINYFVQNRSSTITDAVMSHMSSTCLLDIDTLIQVMTDSNVRTAQWIEDISENPCLPPDSDNSFLDPTQFADFCETMPNYSHLSDLVLEVEDSKSKKEYMNQCLARKHKVLPIKKEDE